ncbi:MAG: ribonuclease G [Saprospiraceae bacterium]
MDKELIINASGKAVDIAILEDRRLVELHQENLGNDFNVGDIFLGSIKKTMPGLNAAFVEIGHPKDAFLHYTDCGPKLSSIAKYTRGVRNGQLTTSRLDNFEIPPDIDKKGSIQAVLQKGDPILVQVLKEPISTKGPRLSCEITIPGRYVVISPFKNMVAVSKKVSTEDERNRLRNLVDSIKPKNFGVIVRTAAEGKGVQDLHEDILNLTNRWDQIFEKLKNARRYELLLKELDKTETVLRDILNESFGKIVVNEKDTHTSIKDYLSTIDKDKIKMVNLYSGKKPLFDHYGITRQIKSSFGKSYTMKSGAYLVIEHTEAMHVVDVNSGPKRKNTDQESAALSVNLEAAEEIARQMKLRDMGGIVIIDFIDMRNADNKKKLLAQFKKSMSSDRAQHTILPLTKFGLMQITRQRTRPEINIKTAEVCPSCRGTGNVEPSLLVTDEIERNLDLIFSARPKVKLKLIVHPFVKSHLLSGWYNTRMKWYRKHKVRIDIQADTSYTLNKFKFFDQNDDEIRLD